LYKIGRFSIDQDTRIWTHASWGGPHCSFAEAFTWNDGGKEENDPNLFDIYVSLKFTGSAYVPDSKKENGIFLDRAILIRPE